MADDDDALTPDATPVIFEAVEGSLDGVHTIVVDPWPSLRWVVLGGRRIPVKPDPEEDFDDLMATVINDFKALLRTSEEIDWSSVAHQMASSVDLSGLLATIASLHEQNGQMFTVLSDLSAITTAGEVVVDLDALLGVEATTPTEGRMKSALILLAHALERISQESADVLQSIRDGEF